jgi:hypothetical protein
MLVFIVNIYIIIYCFQSISTINLSLKRICIDYFYLTMDYANICMKCLKIPKECSEAVNLTRTDNANAKRKRTKLQTMIIYKLLHSKWIVHYWWQLWVWYPYGYPVTRERMPSELHQLVFALLNRNMTGATSGVGI